MKNQRKSAPNLPNTPLMRPGVRKTRRVVVVAVVVVHAGFAAGCGTAAQRNTEAHAHEQQIVAIGRNVQAPQDRSSLSRGRSRWPGR